MDLSVSPPEIYVGWFVLGEILAYTVSSLKKGKTGDSRQSLEY